MAKRAAATVSNNVENPSPELTDPLRAASRSQVEPRRAEAGGGETVDSGNSL
jgi:hypothetical protein